MQETEIGGQFVMLPECNDGDKAWIASKIYNITTRMHEGENLIAGIQRYAILRDYECKYLNIMEIESGIDAEDKARRAANILLREKIKNWKDLRGGITDKRI